MTKPTTTITLKGCPTDWDQAIAEEAAEAEMPKAAWLKGVIYRALRRKHRVSKPVGRGGERPGAGRKPEQPEK